MLTGARVRKFGAFIEYLLEKVRITVAPSSTLMLAHASRLNAHVQQRVSIQGLECRHVLPVPADILWWSQDPRARKSTLGFGGRNTVRTPSPAWFGKACSCPSALISPRMVEKGSRLSGPVSVHTLD